MWVDTSGKNSAWYLLSELCNSLPWLTTVDSFTVPLHCPNGRQLQCKGTVTGVWKSWNSHWSCEPIMQWGTGESQSIFRPTNHKRVTPANWRTCLCIKILHIWTWWDTNLRFMMKNKKWSFQNLQVASDIINLKIISVKMPIWIPKMLKSLIRSL